MSYTTGAQGPQGPQGPHLQGTSGSQTPWGPQGVVSSKQPPFSINSSSFNLTGTVFLMLAYTHSLGKTFALIIQRPVPSQSNLLSVLPDDIVQMANLIDFRPRQGVYYTTATGTAIPYWCIELTGSSVLQELRNLALTTDPSVPVYIANETGL